ncbi:hypothetical protein BGZ95_006427 [Linnemannia exigua]|uniref:Uncharacterized protein n=1 Tax=Linnemannia exigua TaxID=604196 RepID=A0AAD4HBF4_9FUNG|nr:hypothetical protein BGZ95_006427 [Linnemannia exigua]
MGPHLDREHRKLAASASASAAVVVANAGAHSTKTSSNRKERTARASNLSPSGRALGKEGRQAGMELSTELAGTMTTSASSGDNKNTTECTEDTPISAPEPATTPLLPALQMEDEEESPAGIEYSRPAMDTTPTLTGAKLDTGPESTSAFSPPSSPLSSPPLPPATESLPILGSSIIVASHPQTPPRPQTTTPHEMPSDIVHQAPDTPPVTACSPPKETTPIFSLVQQENTDESRPRPLTGTVLATPMVRLQLSPRAESRKTEAKTKTATSAAYTPPAFLSGTPRVFRAFRETSSSRTLSVPQCEIKAAGGEQGRPSEFPTTTVPTTVLSNRSLRVIPTAAEESLEAPYTLATDSIKETPKTLQRPQQPFRKNIWNGRMDSSSEECSYQDRTFGSFGHQRRKSASHKGQRASGHARSDEFDEGAQGIPEPL